MLARGRWGGRVVTALLRHHLGVHLRGFYVPAAAQNRKTGPSILPSMEHGPALGSGKSHVHVTDQSRHLSESGAGRRNTDAEAGAVSQYYMGQGESASGLNYLAQ